MLSDRWYGRRYIPLILRMPRLKDTSMGIQTMTSFTIGGILLTRCRGSIEPKLASRMCKERAAFQANAGYAGYMKRSSL